jgi:hypothetical protein
VWTLKGEAGREEYRKRRVDATAQIEILKGSGYDACFHDGTDRLSVVEEVHQEALQVKRLPDTISPHISSLVLYHMLQPRQKGRLSAIDTYHQGTLRMNEGRRETISLPVNPINPNGVTNPGGQFGHIQNNPDSVPVSVPAPASVSVHSRSHSSFPRQPSPALTSGESSTEEKGRQLHSQTSDLKIKQNGYLNGGTRKVTIEEVYGILKKKNRRFFRRHEELRKEIYALPGIPEAHCEIKSRRGREQV